MADLFDRLLARAAGGTNAVRPKHEVSDVLFFGTGNDREDDVSPEAPHQDGAASVRPTPRDTRGRPEQAPGAQPRSEPPRTPSAPGDEAAQRLPAQAAEGEDQATERVVRPAPDAAARSLDETSPSRRESAAPPPLTRRNSAEPTAEARPRASVPPPAPVDARAAALPPSVDPAPDPPRSDREPGAAQHLPTHRQHTSAPRSVSPRTVSPRTVSPRSESPRPESLRPAAVAVPSRVVEQQAPVIRISIGRIDVRATTPRAPAAPASRTESAQPQLTLDAFLARNGNRGRS